MVPDIDELFRVLKSFGEKRNWHLKYAKFNRQIHQSLLTHCLNVSSLSYSFLDYLDERQFVKATDKLRIQVPLTGFLHDAGKEVDSYQRAVENHLDGRGNEPLDFGHQQDRDIRPAIEAIRKDLEDQFQLVKDFKDFWEEIIWSISQLGQREDAGAVSQSFKKAPSADALVSKEIVHLADVMMSNVSMEDAVSVPLEGSLLSRLQLTYSKVSEVRGVLTQFLHAALESQFADAGFAPVQWFPNGTIYVGVAGAELPRIDSTRLVESIVRKMQDELDRSRPLQMAKAAYGNLRFQVIAAPEFLFADDNIIHEFWQYISMQRFAKPNIKRIDELTEVEKVVYEQISDQLNPREKDDKLILLARSLADFNLLIILYGARKQFVESARNMEDEASRKIQESLSEVLKIPSESVANWPTIVFQTKAKDRLPVAKTLWQSPYYGDPIHWREKLLEALEKATIELATLWRKHVPSKYAKVARLLVSDITYPLLDPNLVMETVDELNAAIAEGKTGHGTSTCQRCGGVAVYEAQAELFGSSEIYHDNLVAGSRVGGGNKIKVCELCEFEEKLHSVFMTRGQEPFSTFYIMPHLALSRNQYYDWQREANEIKYNSGRFPPLLRVNQWAELVLSDGIPSFSSLLERTNGYFSEKEFVRAIEEVAEVEGWEEDLSAMIDPPLDAKNGKAVASYLKQGRCKLKEKYEKRVYEVLNRVEPIYLSPNFILLLTNGRIADGDEPESSVAIKWLFVQCILARLFYATVLDADSIREKGAMLGYTTIPSNVVLKPLEEKLDTRGRWVPISRLGTTLKKLSALLLTAHELSNADAGYGNATLLRLLNEEPGRVLVRMTNRNQTYPKRLISYLDAWNRGK